MLYQFRCNASRSGAVSVECCVDAKLLVACPVTLNVCRLFGFVFVFVLFSFAFSIGW